MLFTLLNGIKLLKSVCQNILINHKLFITFDAAKRIHKSKYNCLRFTLKSERIGRANILISSLESDF